MLFPRTWGNCPILQNICKDFQTHSLWPKHPTIPRETSYFLFKNIKFLVVSWRLDGQQVQHGMENEMLV
jgi:hypothetical protein